MSETLAIGFAARSLVTACTMPVSVIKTRYESGRYSYRTVLQAGRDTLAKEGLRGEHALIEQSSLAFKMASVHQLSLICTGASDAYLP